MCRRRMFEEGSIDGFRKVSQRPWTASCISLSTRALALLLADSGSDDKVVLGLCRGQLKSMWNPQKILRSGNLGSTTLDYSFLFEQAIALSFMVPGIWLTVGAICARLHNCPYEVQFLNTWMLWYDPNCIHHVKQTQGELLSYVRIHQWFLKYSKELKVMPNTFQPETATRCSIVGMCVPCCNFKFMFWCDATKLWL